MRCWCDLVAAGAGGREPAALVAAGQAPPHQQPHTAGRTRFSAALLVTAARLSGTADWTISAAPVSRPPTQLIALC